MRSEERVEIPSAELRRKKSPPVIQSPPQLSFPKGIISQARPPVVKVAGGGVIKKGPFQYENKPMYSITNIFMYKSINI